MKFVDTFSDKVIHQRNARSNKRGVLSFDRSKPFEFRCKSVSELEQTRDVNFHVSPQILSVPFKVTLEWENSSIGCASRNFVSESVYLPLGGFNGIPGCEPYRFSVRRNY